MVYGRALGSVVEQRDLGVQVHSSMKMGSQVDWVVKLFGTLAFISQCIDIELESCVAVVQDFGEAAFGVLCTGLIVLL